MADTQALTDDLYREIILEHWQHPQNYGVLADPDVDVAASNPLCGDSIRVMARIKNKKIDEISFTCSGCAISTAAASLLTTQIKGMPVSKFTATKPETFLSTLQIGFTPVRLKCALLCFSTLKSALQKRG